jgi:hypothetical protein
VRYRLRMKTLICAAACTLLLTACVKPAPSVVPVTADAAPAYHPSMGDLMTMAVQPRHTKLGLAGQTANWKYAAYESSELRHAFDRIAKTIPTYRKADMAAMVASNMKDPLDSLDAAIKVKDAHAFTAAYGQVTQACNACHQGLEHSEVVIKAPSGAAFPDQDFRPAAGG